MATKKNNKKEKVNEPIENEKKNSMGVVLAERLNVREAPELNAKIIMELKKNQTVEVLGIDKDFYKLSNGYAMQKFIKV